MNTSTQTPKKAGAIVPATVSQLFPKPVSNWLRASDLKPEGVVVVVAGHVFKNVKAWGSEDETASKLVVLFKTVDGKPCRKFLDTNKTRAKAFATLAGSEAFDDWVGTCVRLRPGVATNGKPTIIVEGCE